MASILKVDTLTGVTTAGSISVTGEGNSTTTNLQQGLSKQWAYFIATMASIADSLNVSSIADEGTGDSGINITNAMSSANYANSNIVETVNFQGASGNVRLAGLYSKTSSKLNYRGDYVTNDFYAGGYEGAMYHNVNTLGDLA